MFRVVICSFVVYLYVKTVVDQLPRLGKRELICLLLFTCNYVVSFWRGFLFLWVLGMGYVILLWHSLSLQLTIFHYYDLLLAKEWALTSGKLPSGRLAQEQCG